METTVLSIPDISCGHCERTIADALQPLDGVQDVSVDIPTKKVTVQYDPSLVDVNRFKAVLREEDYPVEAVE